MEKVLVVASVISFIEWFNKENIDYLNEKYEVHIAVNADYMEDTDVERTEKYLEKIKSQGVIIHNIHFARAPLAKENVKAYRQLKRVIDNNNFKLIHCHTPAASALTRIAARRARKNGTKVIYSCHGFHFHNASEKMNWLIYYPIERLLAHFSDAIVTINKEDFNRAKTFSCKNVYLIPGVGVDVKKIRETKVDKAGYKAELGIPEDSVLILAVGELIERKNHEVIIRALAKLQRKDLYFAICGKGPLKDYLQQLAKELRVEDRVLFLGYRTDIAKLVHVADIGVFPSKIEGLGLAGIEIIAAGTPLVSSNVQGILDYVIDGKTGYALNPKDVDGFAKAIKKLADNPELRAGMREDCIKAAAPFEISNALKAMRNIYREVLKEDEVQI